ncbi:MAG: hypothetical protein JNK65_09870 [Deltaproteobacteria bacterium]|nr:hypothetical protein [Deltaproteobacteria bacterium]
MFGIRPLSILLGTAAETLTVQNVQRHLFSNPLTDHPSSSNFINSYFTFLGFKGAGRLTQNENIFLQHLFQDTTMVASQHFEAIFASGLYPSVSLFEQFLNAENTTLHLGLGFSLFHRFLPQIQAFERSLLLTKCNPEIRHTDRGERVLTELRNTFQAHAANAESLYFIESNTRLSSTDTQALRERYSSRFHPHIRTEILERVLNLPFSDPAVHESLLQSLDEISTRFSNATSINLVRVIHQIYLTNPKQTSTGSVESLFLHHLLDTILSNRNSSHRNTQLTELFQNMKNGLNEDILLNQLRRIDSTSHRITEELEYTEDFYHQHIQQITQHWALFSANAQTILFNHLYHRLKNHPRACARWIQILGRSVESDYTVTEVEAVIHRAQTHPLGRLLMDRLLHVVIAQDGAFKLREMADTGPHLSSQEVISGLHQAGFNGESIADAINKTRHTAYLDDMRLARKVVSVNLELENFRSNPQLLNHRRKNLEDGITTLLTYGIPFTSEHLAYFLNLNPNSMTESLRGRVQNKQNPERPIQLRFLSESDMQEYGRNLKQSRLRELIQMLPGENHPASILIEDIAPYQLEDFDHPGRLEQVREQIISRLEFLAHGYEHWRHFSGSYEGLEQGGEAIQTQTISNENRLLIEIMARLEQTRWLYSNTWRDTHPLAHLQGSSLATYFRDETDASYFRAVRTRLIRDFFAQD